MIDAAARAKFDALTDRVRSRIKLLGHSEHFAVEPCVQEFLVHTAQRTNMPLDDMLANFERNYLSGIGAWLN